MDGSGVFGREKAGETEPELVDKAPALGKQAETPRPSETAPAAANDDLRPDDERLLGEDQIRDEFQNERGIKVHMDRARDANLTEFGKATLSDRYLMPGESFQDLFARVAAHYADDSAHAQRLYDYISRLWFMPATPVLSNGGTSRGLPISCFLNEAGDSLDGIVGLWNENVWLAARGGGIGSYWGNLRSIGEKVGHNGKTSGIIPFIRVMDSLTLAISQGSLRRGSAACYIPISHPEIEEFIELRRPTGGDPNRKALNLHHGIVISDAFMRAVEHDEEWGLVSPKDNAVIRKVRARDLWIRILTARIETGEPYIIYGDHVNRQIPQHHKLAGLTVKMSNLCSEITLPTGLDHHGVERTAVCCLSSLNLEKYFEWHEEEGFIEDVMRFLDNVLQDFIEKAPDSMARAKYSAERERSVGLGVMGFHSFMQANRIPLEGVMAKVWNRKIFAHIREQADAASKKLAEERGPCPDAEEFGIMERFSNKMAIAPTASISIICGGASPGIEPIAASFFEERGPCPDAEEFGIMERFSNKMAIAPTASISIICGGASPGIEPIAANSFTHKTLSGSFNVRNKHLTALLEEKGENNEEVWTSITINGGSVQHLDFLDDDEKDVFKTAFELDQRWLIEHAGDRAGFICQAQSLNVFVPADVHKRDLHQIHYLAWKKGVKSLYYCRSKSIQRAESALAAGPAAGATVPHLGKISSKALATGGESTTDYEECLACQ